jgi:hypothetical protein
MPARQSAVPVVQMGVRAGMHRSPPGARKEKRMLTPSTRQQQARGQAGTAGVVVPKRLRACAAAAALLMCGALPAYADGGSDGAVVVTASNATTNQLLVYSPAGALLDTVATHGQGGVGGNAGGIAAADGLLAVVNAGSNNVTVMSRAHGPASFRVDKVIPTYGSPVSVAFGDDHLYILTGTSVESHALRGRNVASAADGMAPLLHADGSAAQVGVMRGELIITEKSNAIEAVKLDAHGAVAGAAAMVAGIPANVDTPLGLVTRGNEAYVTIAHADEISLVRNDKVLATTPSLTQHAPCWLALDGPFLFSTNSPSKSVSRYAVYGRQIVQDAAVAAQFNGAPTDIAYKAGLAAVIDSTGSASHVSIFNVDQDGNLALRGVATLNNPKINGIAIVGGSDGH